MSFNALSSLKRPRMFWSNITSHSCSYQSMQGGMMLPGSSGYTQLWHIIKKSGL